MATPEYSKGLTEKERLVPLNPASVTEAQLWMENEVRTPDQRRQQLFQLKTERRYLHDFLEKLNNMRNIIQFPRLQFGTYENGALFMLKALEVQHTDKKMIHTPPTRGQHKQHFDELIGSDTNKRELDIVKAEMWPDEANFLLQILHVIAHEHGSLPVNTLRESVIATSNAKKEALFQNEPDVSTLLGNPLFTNAFGGPEALSMGMMDVYELYKPEKPALLSIEDLNRLWEIGPEVPSRPVK